jgi:alpha-tubulin suppressor-like RCC1 family protein
MLTRYPVRFLVQICAILCLAACSDALTPNGAGTEVDQLWISATGWVLEPESSVRFGLRAGSQDNTVLYETPATPIHSWPKGLRVEWTSSDPSVATVSDSGVVRAVNPGRVTIRVASGGAGDSVTVAVGRPIGTQGKRYLGVAVAGGHTCGLDGGGQTACWGGNWHGELGVGYRRRHTSFLSPVRSASEHTFTALNAGFFHTCGLTPQGTAYCWGEGANGKLGDPAVRWTDSRAAPVRVRSDVAFVSLSSGGEHNCALTSDGSAYCWGLNDYGQIGDGRVGLRNSRSQPVQVKTDLRFSVLALGLAHTCGLTSAGKAYCWGSNDDGQLGTGAATSSTAPVAVGGDLRFTSLEAGTAHTCALTEEGRAFCWGRNWRGQLGTGTLDNAVVPVPIASDLRFTSINAGGEHTCAIAVTGTAYCWGSNWRGQLGDDFPFEVLNYTAADLIRTTPVPVAGRLLWAEVSAGWADHSCGITTDHTAYCWGANNGGTLGTGGSAFIPGTELRLEAKPTPVVTLP